MSVCLIAMIRDEADLAEAFVRHSVAHVDALIVADNNSSDGTREILDELARDLPLTVIEDDDPAYYQSRKISLLATRAREAGHSWAVAADCDEVWYVTGDGDRRIADYLAGLAPDVQVIEAKLFHHIPSGADDTKESNPFRRIGWRKREPGTMPKVCCRLAPDLVIAAGNHAATYGHGRAFAVPGLAVRHFSWRTREQFMKKIRNGEAAYSQTNLPPEIGAHWRMFQGASDEEIMEHFDRWFYTPDPMKDDSLVFDPAPVRT